MFPPSDILHGYNTHVWFLSSECPSSQLRAVAMGSRTLLALGMALDRRAITAIQLFTLFPALPS